MNYITQILQCVIATMLNKLKIDNLLFLAALVCLSPLGDKAFWRALGSQQVFETSSFREYKQHALFYGVVPALSMRRRSAMF